MAPSPVLRLAAFASEPGGGNPAGVVVADALPTAGEMQRTAAEVGYSETAFLAPAPEDRQWTVPAVGFEPTLTTF